MKKLRRLFTISFYLLVAAVADAENVPSKSGESIGIKIMGTIVQKDKNASVVLIKEVESGKVKALRVGHALMKKYRVDSIVNEYIEVSNSSEKMRIYQDKFAGQSVANNAAPAANATYKYAENYSEEGFERKKGAIKMTAMYRDNLIKNDLSKILMQSTAEPYMENGKIAGFKLTQIDADSIYDKSGIRDNDVITSINGNQLNNVAGAIKLLHSLKNENSIEMTVLRDGAETSVTISVD